MGNLLSHTLGFYRKMGKEPPVDVLLWGRVPQTQDTPKPTRSPVLKAFPPGICAMTESYPKDAPATSVIEPTQITADSMSPVSVGRTSLKSDSAFSVPTTSSSIELNENITVLTT